MTDKKARGLILQFLYDHRKERRSIPELKPEMFDGGLDENEIRRLSRDLRDAELIEGTMTGGGVLIHPSISRQGIDVMEGEAESPIGIQIVHNDSRRFTFGDVSGSNFLVGDHNTQTVAAALRHVLESIEAANTSEEEKADAKDKVRALIRHPLFVEAFGTLGPVLGNL